MARYRVGAEGLRVITTRGTYSLPPGVVLNELPDRYEGTLTTEPLIESEPKRLEGYETAVIRPGEVKR